MKIKVENIRFYLVHEVEKTYKYKGVVKTTKKKLKQPFIKCDATLSVESEKCFNLCDLCTDENGVLYYCVSGTENGISLFRNDKTKIDDFSLPKHLHVISKPSQTI